MRRALFLGALTAAAGLPLAYAVARHLMLLPDGLVAVVTAASLGSGALILVSFCPPRSASLGAWLAQVGALLDGSSPGVSGWTEPVPEAVRRVPKAAPAARQPSVTESMGSVVVAAASPARPPPFEPTAPLLPSVDEPESRTVRELLPAPKTPQHHQVVVLPVTATARVLPAAAGSEPEDDDARTVRHLPTAGPPPPAIPPVKFAEALAPQRPRGSPPSYQASYEAQEGAAPMSVRTLSDGRAAGF